MFRPILTLPPLSIRSVRGLGFTPGALRPGPHDRTVPSAPIGARPPTVPTSANLLPGRYSRKIRSIRPRTSGKRLSSRAFRPASAQSVCRDRIWRVQSLHAEKPGDFPGFPISPISEHAFRIRFCTVDIGLLYSNAACRSHRPPDSSALRSRLPGHDGGSHGIRDDRQAGAGLVQRPIRDETRLTAHRRQRALRSRRGPVIESHVINRPLIGVRGPAFSRRQG